MSEKVLEASLEELPSVAKEIMESHPDERIFAFRGELGAGKTSLIKNICNFLGVNEPVQSPTFSLVNEYDSSTSGKIYHFDFYRLNSLEEALDIGVEDYFYSGQICFIEWPEKIEELLPEEGVDVKILPMNERRKFILKKWTHV